MSLLLLFGGAGTFTPLTTTAILGIAHADEAAVGASTQVWASFIDNAGSTSPVNAQITIYKVEDDGTLTTESALSGMMAEGDGFTYDWTPSESGTFLIAVAADDGVDTFQVTSPISARSKFDPIALALHDVLVTRF